MIDDTHDHVPSAPIVYEHWWHDHVNDRLVIPGLEDALAASQIVA